MSLTLNAWHNPEHQAWQPRMVSITGETPIKTISGYYTPAELRTLARQLITIANDSDQGEQGPVTYTAED
ncbi:hypothetical protein ACI2KX_15780 [Ectopseudomonas khazarica]|uniref:hypothetical protein n=1 Tax=Ectopseudomonas khazarica TaxID=2502979 RepID=UPI003850B73C